VGRLGQQKAARGAGSTEHGARSERKRRDEEPKRPNHSRGRAYSDRPLATSQWEIYSEQIRLITTALDCGHTSLLRVEASNLESSRSVGTPEAARYPLIHLVEETAGSCAIYHTHVNAVAVSHGRRTATGQTVNGIYEISEKSAVRHEDDIDCPGAVITVEVSCIEAGDRGAEATMIGNARSAE
jgi:hypothetical protein